MKLLSEFCEVGLGGKTSANDRIPMNCGSRDIRIETGKYEKL